MGVFGLPQTRLRKKKFHPAVRTAEKPGQTMNIDLCFVPDRHEAEQKLPAVSGSSGRLVVERRPEAKDEATFPGRVFEDKDRPYPQAMLDYLAASKQQEKPALSGQEVGENPSARVQKWILREEETRLRDERRALRKARAKEDAVWQAQKQQHQQEKVRKAKSSPLQQQAQQAQWRVQRKQRQEVVQRRKQEDQAWRQKRLEFRNRWSQFPVVAAWIAILVITDNCTRQCLGLPLFVAGAQVTSAMIVEALQQLLPPELQFLITDRGTHFRAGVFQKFSESAHFIHVRIARHRPQSNGIAERFVRTLKEALRGESWENHLELADLLVQFQEAYNDRPHQGLSIPGLSPNEFAIRISALSS
jgi:transposase InsO family protein